MILQALHCLYCHGTDIVRHGQTWHGKQRYRCREKRCAGRTFLLDYSYRGQSPEVKQQIVDMAMNASGIRDTARVLHISPNTPIVSLDVISLVTNSCGYYRSQIEQRAAHSFAMHLATQRALATWRQHRHSPRAQPVAPLRKRHGRRPPLTPRRGTPQARHREQGHPGDRTREEKRPKCFTFLAL